MANKRFTVKMVNAKKMDVKKYDEVLDDWIENHFKKNKEEILEHIAVQILGALYLDDISDKTRIDIIRTCIRTEAYTLFTPKAFEAAEKELREFVNEKYEAKTLGGS